MSQTVCQVCSANRLRLLYAMQPGHSLTSLGQLHPGETRVWACDSCAHVQTDEMEGVAEYYDQQYNILVESEEEDQIYEVRDGRPLYRTAHQVAVLQDKLRLPEGARLLDYGCAKSSTMQALQALRPDLQPHFFDVSERYRSFWEKFAKPEQWAIYTPRAEWAGSFDVITSFFSLEHIVQPLEALRSIHALVKPGGLFYCVVPNVQSNIADFIVIDHVNHFTQCSLARLLTLAGFAVREIDAQAHRGAFVVVAQRQESVEPSASQDADAVAATLVELRGIAAFWQAAAQRTQAYVAALAEDAVLAVYGAGFYGAFIASCLAEPARIRCYVDQNPFLQGRQLNDRPIVAPSALSEEVNTLLVGLNPGHARQIIAEIPALAERSLRYFYL